MHRSPHSMPPSSLPSDAPRLVFLASAEASEAAPALDAKACRELVRRAGFDPGAPAEAVTVDAPRLHCALPAHRDADGLLHAAGPAYSSLALPLRPARQATPSASDPAPTNRCGEDEPAAGDTTETLLDSAPDVPSLLVQARATVPEAEVCMVPAGLRGDAPRMLIMDVDSTLIRQEVIDELAAHAGRAAQVAEVTERAMRGELDFEDSLRERVAALAGLPVHVLDEVRARLTLTAGARTLIRSFRQRGEPVCVVSGGFSQILDPLAQDLGLSRARANRLEVRHGRLTGRVEGPVVDAEAKEASLHAWATEFGVSSEHTVAVGDGANDLRMVGAAGLGIGLVAKPALRDAADVRVPWPRLDAVATLLES